MRLARVMVIAAAITSTKASPQLPQTSPTASDTLSLSDTVSLRNYMDEFLARDLEFLRVPGAVVGIVYKGNVVLLRGYGVSNLDTKTAVDPERTVFRVGSVTKPFTATAVMQLAEQGELDLNADVNRYLRDMKVPAGPGRPITVADLLTHTAGFDVILAGTAARTEDEVEPLGKYLARNLPPRVRQAGNTIAYSNHGYTLLGHLVEQISGEEYSEYIKRHILDPLRMTSSTMRFGPDVEARSATGYEPRGLNGHRVAPPVHPNIVPAASLNTTAKDMTRFMIAQLSGGAIDGTRILADSTVRLMQSRLFSQDARMPGITYGFFESDWNGRRMVFHSGGIRGFMSAVYLWPDEQVGLFVADNGYRGDLAFTVLFHFMDRYLPGKKRPRFTPKPRERAHLAKYAGFYEVANHTQSNLEKAGGIRNDALEVRVTDSGTVTAFGIAFAEVAPRYFREVNGEESLAFLEDSSGNVKGVVTTYPFPGTETWARVSFLETGVPSQIVMITTLIAAMFVLIHPPRIRGGRDWARQEQLIPADLLIWSRRTAQIARALAAAQLLFLALMWMGARTPGGMLYGVPWQMDAAGIIAVLGSLLLAILVVQFAIALIRRWPSGHLVGVGLFIAVSGLFVTVQQHWNVLGIHH